MFVYDKAQWMSGSAEYRKELILTPFTILYPNKRDELAEAKDIKIPASMQSDKPIYYAFSFDEDDGEMIRKSNLLKDCAAQIKRLLDGAPDVINNSTHRVTFIDEEVSEATLEVLMAYSAYVNKKK